MPRPDQGVRTTALIQPTSTSVGNVIHALQTTKGRLNACPSLFISLKPNNVNQKAARRMWSLSAEF